MSNTQIFILNVENIIRKKGFKKCMVAQKAGLTPNMFSAMLNNRKIITAEHIPNIANALGVPVGELYKKEGDEDVNRIKRI